MEFKHFSHPHPLSFHQTPETREAICSGCKSLLSSGSVYSCWPCNFLLHEQCFNAARSMDHPSHPSHPLSLFPSPTYPSGSFFCNFCNLTGTGFSYSCSSCEFDLHVHCSYMPVNTNHGPYPNLSNQTHSSSQETATYNHHYPQTTAYGNVFASLTPQYSFPSESANPPYPYISEATSHGSYVSSPAPPYFPPHEPQPGANAQFGVSGHPISPSPHVLPYTSELYPSNPPYAHISEPKVNHPNHPYISANEPPPTVNAPVGAHTQSEPRQQTHTAVSTTHGVPEPATHKSSDGPKEQTIPNKDFPNSNLQADVQQPRNLKHFSHHHALRLSEVEEEDYVLCSGCEQHLSGTACRCTKPKCDFRLHKTCFELPGEIPHKSHPEHSLVLLASPPYKEDGEFTCNACSLTGTAFDYHCKICRFDLHVKCATLSETVKREDHEHPLKLLFSTPYKKGEDLVFYCDVCQSIAEEDCWVYYCQECDFGTHLDCVMADREEPDEETEQLSEADSLVAAQMRLQQLQMQTQMNQQILKMSQQNAQFVMSIGQSMSNLAG